MYLFLINVFLSLSLYLSPRLSASPLPPSLESRKFFKNFKKKENILFFRGKMSQAYITIKLTLNLTFKFKSTKL